MAEQATGYRVAGEELPMAASIVVLGVGLLAAAASAHMIVSGGAGAALPVPVPEGGGAVVRPTPELAVPQPMPVRVAVEAAGWPVEAARVVATRAAASAASRPVGESPAVVSGECAPELVVVYRSGSLKSDIVDGATRDRFVAWMLEHPEAKAAVDGYANATGDPGYNLKLSHERARRVVKQLIKLGIEPDRLTARGFGQYSPVIGAHETDQINRRVVARVMDVPVCRSEETP